jgi:hypothetical protein
VIPRVLITAAVQLSFFNQESKDPSLKDDLTLGYWRSAICNQITQCLAIVTTCLPYTKIFMEGFESGLMRLDDLRRRGEHSTTDNSGRGYQLMDISRSAKEQAINVKKSWTVEVEPVKSLASSSRRSFPS